MKKKLFILFGVFLNVFLLSAQVTKTVTVSTPGTLADVLGADKASITNLEVLGTINAADFAVFKQMKALKILDLGKTNAVDNTVPASSFENSVVEELILPKSVKSLGGAAFHSSNIKKLILPEGITEFSGRLFWDANMEGIDWSLCSKNVKVIRGSAFIGVKTDIDLSTFTQLEEVEPYAFSGMTSTVTYPAHLKSTFHGDFSAFKGKVILPEGLLEIATSSFAGTVMEELILPKSVKSLGGAVFHDSNIKKLILPEGITEFSERLFWDANMKGIDWSLCAKNIKVIKGAAFIGVKTDIDLSTFIQLEKIEPYAFSGMTSTVTYPAHLKSTFPGDFAGFNGRAILPKGLLEIEHKSFENTVMEELIIPSSVNKLGDRAFVFSNIKKLILPEGITEFSERLFWNANMEGIDWSLCAKNIKVIRASAFEGVKIDIDLSTFIQLEKVEPYAFSGMTSTVTYPAHLKSTFPGDFAGFNGRAILPEGLLEIEHKSFENTVMEELIIPSSVNKLENRVFAFSNIKKLILPEGITEIPERSFWGAKNTTITIPSSVTKIDDYAFLDCSFLQEIISLNSTPPTLGNNVFNGVDKTTCVLNVPASSIPLYGVAEQWKDFLHYKPYIPKEVNLTFTTKITANALIDMNGNEYIDDRWDHINLMTTYKGVKVGEYYWSETFNQEIPTFRWWTAEEGVAARYPITQELLDLYLLQVHIDYTKYPASHAHFTKYYGAYYDQPTTAYMGQWSRMFEGTITDSTLVKKLVGASDGYGITHQKESGWSFASNTDYRQLFAMCPFYTEGRTQLEPLDVLIALGVKQKENPLAYDMDNGTSKKTYWFGLAKNIYEFNMMPGGSRLVGHTSTWGNGLSMNTLGVDLVKQAGLGHLTTRTTTESGDIWTGPRGAFSHLFYTVSYRSGDGQIVLHDRLDTATPRERQDCVDDGENIADSNTYGKTSYAWMNTRWCRRLTDEELGYKLFISIANINKLSKEWIALSDETYEIPLLKQIKRGVYSPSDIDIVKINDSKATAPEGYVELPNGYIRGFYVQYFIENMNSGKSLSDIVNFASKVLDNALDIASVNPTRALKQSTDLLSTTVSDEQSVSLHIHPNPVNDILNIEGVDNIQRVVILNLLGKTVKAINDTDSEINVSDLPSGTYILRVESDKNVHTVKIIKQ